MNFRTPRVARLVAASFLGFAALVGPAQADLPPDVAAKVEKAKKRLVELAADPAVLAAVREANGREPTLSNGKWIDLQDNDPAVRAIVTNKVSLQIAKWEQADETVNKILLRDQKGNLIGASTRPLIFNNANRPVFANAIKGQRWNADEVKPDTTTQVPSVHLSAPVMDGGKPIGVMHAAVTAK